MLTTFEEDDYIFGSLSAGASGFAAHPRKRGVLELVAEMLPDLGWAV